jgi:hypothetical protein
VEELEQVWVCCGWRTPPTAHSNLVNVPYHETSYPALCECQGSNPALKSNYADCELYNLPQSASIIGALK